MRSAVAPSPGLEPELSEPKSDVLPITPRRTTHQRRADTLAVGRPPGQPRALMPSSDCSATDNLVGVAAPEKEVRAPRARMTGSERRHQLIDIARSLFAERGYEGTSIEEIALRANVSKPVVYEHFGGKEGLYAVVVDREVERLTTVTMALSEGPYSKPKFEAAAVSLLRYIEDNADGFRILVRDSSSGSGGGTYSSLLNDAVNQVSSILAGDFARRGLDPDLARSE